MQISKREQNSSPIIPQISLNGIGMYDRIKEEIKGEIEICVPAKVLSISGSYATVQPLPNKRTNANKFIERKPIAVKYIGNISIGDVGYLISGDVSNLNKNGISVHSTTYDPMEEESHKFSNGFFISQGDSGVDRVNRCGYYKDSYTGTWNFYTRGIILEDRFDSFLGGGLAGYPEDLYELREHYASGSLSNIINNTSNILKGDTSLLEKISLREYNDVGGILSISALFSYSEGNRLYPDTIIGISDLVITGFPAVGYFESNPYRTERNIQINNTVFGKMPPFSVLLLMYDIDLYDYYKNGGDPIIIKDYSDLMPRSLPYFGKKYYPKIEPTI